MGLYDVDIDLANTNTSHVQVVDLVGDSARVLDVGCWTGDLGRVLKQRGAHVSGLELDTQAAARAAEDLDAVAVADLDRTRLTDHFAPASFDAVVFADILEHLHDPARALGDAVDLLDESGRIVISVPNVTHGSLRLALLQGRWTTTDTGLLDHTHIRFFTRESLLALVAEAGLVVDDLRATVFDPFGTEVDIDPAGLPAGVIDWVRAQPDAHVYQFQLAARRARPGEQPVAPELSMPIDPGRARPTDARRLDLVRVWRRELVERERVVALEATSETARAHSRWAAARIAKLERQLEEARADASAPPPGGRGRRVLGRVRRRLTR